MAGGYASAVEGEIIDPETHNEYVRDQTVNRFTSSAARSSAITLPEAGMASALTTNDAAEGLYLVNSAGQWRLPWNMPWGEQFWDTTTATTSTAGSADIGGLAGSFTPVANRKYLVQYIFGRVQLTVSGGEASIAAQHNASNMKIATVQGAANDIRAVSLWYRFTAASATAVTLKATLNAGSAGNIAIAVPGGDTVSGEVIVLDIGPGGAPS